jgi:hypothetical protein
MQKLALGAVLLLTGCSNYIAGTVNGQQPFQVRSTLFMTWPPTAITFSTADADTTCNLLTQRASPGGGGMLISGLTGEVGSNTVCPDSEARAGRCGRTVVRYWGPDESHEYDWTGTVTITNIAGGSVRGEFDLLADADQLRGQFDAKPCLNY